MKANGRRLFKQALGCLGGILFLGMACKTTTMAEEAAPAVMTAETNVQIQTEEDTELLALAAQQQAMAATAQQQAVEQQAAAAQTAQAQHAMMMKAAQEAQAAAAAEAAARQAAAVQAVILTQAGVSQQEFDLLSALIQCEAGGESHVGKVAVGNVVLNRVEAAQHPNTITEVIYEPGQFSPVRNGSLRHTLETGRISDGSRQAALEALAGSEPVGDKLFFRRNNGRRGQVIGNHVFY